MMSGQFRNIAMFYKTTDVVPKCTVHESATDLRAIFVDAGRWRSKSYVLSEHESGGTNHLENCQGWQFNVALL